MSTTTQFLNSVRINMVMQALQDKRGIPQKLAFLDRTPIVPAADGEIMARVLGHVLIADLVADDQKAGVYSAGKVFLESTTAPNLKLGQLLTQEQINQMMMLETGNPGFDNVFPTTETRIIDNLRQGVLQRMEALMVACAIDGFSYDRLGIKMQNVSWGMPADLKVTPTNPWTDTALGTPVSDILILKRVAMVRYGMMYDRLTMSLSTFNAMIATTEFQTRSRTYLAPNVSFVNLNIQNAQDMQSLAQSVLGIKEIELYDQRYWAENEDGTIVSAPYLPINKVVLSSTQSDNDASVIDFANGIVTEAKVMNIAKIGNFGALPPNARGPVGYVDGALNPPQLTYFGVGRGFPRKHMLQATAVLTVAPTTGTGSIAETVPYTDLFVS